MQIATKLRYAKTLSICHQIPLILIPKEAPRYFSENTMNLHNLLCEFQ